MVPNGWTTAKIKDIASINVGRDLRLDSYTESITATHIYPVYSNTVENRGLYGFYDFPEYSGGSVTIVGRGIGLGTAFARHKDEKFGAIGRLLVLTPKGDSFDVGYLTDYINFLLRIHNEDGGIPQLPGASLGNYDVTLPPYLEQKKIAQILSTWDKAITTTEKLLDQSQKQKQALMQQLLTGKKRFPEFSGHWVTKTLGDIGEIKSAGVDKNIVEGEKPVRLLNFTDVFKRSFIYSNELDHWVTTPEAKLKSCDVQKGDVFFTPSSETRDEVAIPAVAAEDISNCCYSYHVVRFRIKEKWDLNFKAYIFTTPKFRKQANMLADGSGQRYVISQGGFRGMKITYPSYEEQIVIGKALKTAEDEVNLLKQKIIYLKEEKKALMQQLLTGKRRVKVDH